MAHNYLGSGVFIVAVGLIATPIACSSSSSSGNKADAGADAVGGSAGAPADGASGSAGTGATGGTSASGGGGGASATGGTGGASGGSGGASTGGTSGSGGSGATGGTGASGGTGGTGASGGGGSGGSTGGGGSVVCGSTSCPVKTSYCCAKYNQPWLCQQNGSTCTYGVAVPCDGPEDCPGTEVCCATLFVQGKNLSYQSVACASSCSGRDQRVVCGASGACPSGTVCGTSDVLPPYRDCK